MDFIANNWWLWLGGLVIVLIVVGVRSIMNLVGLAKDAVELSSKVRGAWKTPEERTQKMTDLGIELVGNKLKRRAVATVVNSVLLLVGGVFGVLLALAAWRHYS